MAHNEKQWQEAKKRCRLNDDDIKLAKQMGLNPKSLIRNIPNKNEMWKLPVNQWIHNMYEERKEKSAKKAQRKLLLEKENKDII